jgi:hypothetical protein
MAVQKGKGGITARSMADGKAVAPSKLFEELYAGQYFRALFPQVQPVARPAATPYGDPTGATGDSNHLAFVGPLGSMDALYHIKWAGQTLLAPANDATNGGLLAGLDVAASEGVEYVPGAMLTVHNPFAVVAGDGDYPAMFIRLRFAAGTVANVAQCAVGFRKAEAAQADKDDYDEAFWVNLIAGDIYRDSILNGAANVAVDTGLDVADDEEVTIEVQVRGTRAEGFVNGLPISAGALFNFDAGEVVIPDIFFLQGAGGGSTLLWKELEVGPLWLVGRDGSRR